MEARPHANPSALTWLFAVAAVAVVTVLAPKVYDFVVEKYLLHDLGMDGDWEPAPYDERQDPPPVIETSVRRVAHEKGVVVLSAGRSKDVEVGLRFTIARGGWFVGKVEVIKVTSRLSAARVLFTRLGKSVEPGDIAYTWVE